MRHWALALRRDWALARAGHWPAQGIGPRRSLGSSVAEGLGIPHHAIEPLYVIAFGLKSFRTKALFVSNLTANINSGNTQT
ncbi:hypothetical protein IQ269_03905 [Tychonema sp. LEGE 07199]|uniref:hypothetical protein n=1 Tax=unclassified Tychonema TaxID=2642144 RepID=UPI0018819BA6|nr:MULTISPECIES: hypothetical protein [unclassified Tychonema]MBE9119969.1 hypothetical protein [Tychonema sp. LEGE 07199]MBE9134483.1 hypothetical protein [Tychonema sp. LEGE 07196]